MSPCDSELSAFRHRDPRVYTASASVTSPFHAGHGQLLSILSSFTQKSLPLHQKKKKNQDSREYGGFIIKIITK